MQHVLTGQLVVGIVLVWVQQLVSLPRRCKVLRTPVQGDRRAEDNARPAPRGEHGLQEIPRATHIDGLSPRGALLALWRDDKGQMDNGIDTLNSPCHDLHVADVAPNDLDLAGIGAVSYTHLTLPTIYSV